MQQESKENKEKCDDNDEDGKEEDPYTKSIREDTLICAAQQLYKGKHFLKENTHMTLACSCPQLSAAHPACGCLR